MSNHSLSAQNLMATLPQVLQIDPELATLASSIADILAKRGEEIRRIAIYSRIDELPEDLLDILAYDFKVDWWDRDFSVDEKRRLLKSCWRVHRVLGTKAAVVTAVEAIFPGAQVSEWFEYGGEPYHFRLLIDSAYKNVSPEKHQKVLDSIACYANLRSVLDGVEYIDISGVVTQYFGTAMLAETVVDGAIAVSY